jgi:hypothetical protein
MPADKTRGTKEGEAGPDIYCVGSAKKRLKFSPIPVSFPRACVRVYAEIRVAGVTVGLLFRILFETAHISYKAERKDDSLATNCPRALTSP